ncbi:MAG TPA: TonB-dependent siderophore receptor, partial [Erwinia persicina]|nr:TonB-dependent siderophore receptor [Erwinia persicina]
MTKMMKAQVRPGVAVTSGKASLRLLVASALVGVPVSQAATENTLTVTAETRESVTGRNSGLVAKESAAGTKTATPLRKTPQSISVVTRE